MKYIRLNEKLNKINEHDEDEISEETASAITDKLGELYIKYKSKIESKEGIFLYDIPTYIDDVDLEANVFVHGSEYTNAVFAVFSDFELYPSSIRCNEYVYDTNTKYFHRGGYTTFIKFNTCYIHKIKEKNFEVSPRDTGYFLGDLVYIENTNIVNLTIGENCDKTEVNRIILENNKNLKTIKLSDTLETSANNDEPLEIVFEGNPNISEIELNSDFETFDIYIETEKDMYVLDLLKDKLSHKSRIFLPNNKMQYAEDYYK